MVMDSLFLEHITGVNVTTQKHRKVSIAQNNGEGNLFITFIHPAFI